MSIVSFISSKGGTGKTTSAFLLADRIINRAGLEKVTVIDADPNKPWAFFWDSCEKKPKNLEIISETNPDQIINKISSANQTSNLVIIDTEGTLNQNALNAARCSDLILIPMQTSKLDFNEGIRTLNTLINPGEGFEDIAINYKKIRCFWTRTSAAIISRVEKECRQTAEEAKLPFLKTSIIDRAAYAAVFQYSATLDDLTSQQASGLENAKQLADSFTLEILGTLTEIKNKENGVQND